MRTRLGSHEVVTRLHGDFKAPQCRHDQRCARSHRIEQVVHNVAGLERQRPGASPTVGCVIHPFGSAATAPSPGGTISGVMHTDLFALLKHLLDSGGVRLGTGPLRPVRAASRKCHDFSN